MMLAKIFVSLILAVGIVSMFSGAIEEDRGTLVILVPIILFLGWIILK